MPWSPGSRKAPATRQATEIASQQQYQEAFRAFVHEWLGGTPGTALRADHAVTRVAVSLAAQHAPSHDEGLYCLSDTTTLYARRLLLQATASAFGDTAEGRLLRSLDAWEALGGRQCRYTEADAEALHRIGEALTGAALEIAEEITALADRIDGA